MEASAEITKEERDLKTKLKEEKKILLMANQEGHLLGQLIVMAALLITLLLTFIALLLSGRLNQLLGVTGMHVVSRIMGVLLSALAVQFIFDGISQSGLVPIQA